MSFPSDKKTPLKIKYGHQPTQEDIEYRKMMAEEVAKTVVKRPKPTCPPGMSRDEWIESMQPASTRAVMQKHRDPNYKPDLTRPLPENVLANPGAKTLDDLVGMKPRDAEQVMIVERMRRGAKNTLGQSEKSGSGEERKERAADAWLYTPGVTLTELEAEQAKKLKKIEGNVVVKSGGEPMLKGKVNVFKRLLNFLKGETDTPRLSFMEMQEFYGDKEYAEALRKTYGKDKKNAK